MPKFSDDGSIDPKWLMELKPDKMAEWLCEVIREREPNLPDIPEEGYLFLAESYEELAENLRAVFRQALVCLLSEMAKSQDSQDSLWWTDRIAGDRLIYLVGSVYSSLRPGDAEVTKLLLSILENEPPVEPEAEYAVDIHGRILQALMTMNVQLPFEFWENEVKHNPAAYLGVGLRGASRCTNSRVHSMKLLGYASDVMDEEIRLEIEDVLEILSIDMGKNWLREGIRSVNVPGWCNDLVNKYGVAEMPQPQRLPPAWSRDRREPVAA